MQHHSTALEHKTNNLGTTYAAQNPIALIAFMQQQQKCYSLAPSELSVAILMQQSYSYAQKSLLSCVRVHTQVTTSLTTLPVG